MWKTTPTDDYVRQRKWYDRKKPRELGAVEENLNKYLKALNGGLNPVNIKDGAVRSEGESVYRVGQQGSSYGKVAETRLYVYPDVEASDLLLLTIGDKRTQTADIKACKECVRAIKKQRALENERAAKQQREKDRAADNAQDVQQRSGDGKGSVGGQGAGRESSDAT
jgi:hypothetical protein